MTSRRSPHPDGSTKSMTFFMACIPLMVLAVALAVLPLILTSHAEHRDGHDGGGFPQQERFLRWRKELLTAFAQSGPLRSRFAPCLQAYERSPARNVSSSFLGAERRRSGLCRCRGSDEDDLFPLMSE
jgi:hypothetical protein